MTLRYKIKIVDRGGRLRAVLTSADGKHHFAEWWIESADHGRYKPLKPVPVKAWLVLGSLPEHRLRRIAEFLMTAEEGDEIVFER